MSGAMIQGYNRRARRSRERAPRPAAPSSRPPSLHRAPRHAGNHRSQGTRRPAAGSARGPGTAASSSHRREPGAPHRRCRATTWRRRWSSASTRPSCAASSTSMHAADVAYILESLPIDERLAVWDLVKAERDGEILLEVSDAVRESLIRSMDSEELVAAAEQLDADELADLAPDLPEEVIQDVFQSLPVEEREQLRAAMSYPDDAVGALMDFEVGDRARGRHAGGGDALPAPLRGAARPYRPDLRGRPRGAAEGRAADREARRHRSRHAGRRGDGRASSSRCTPTTRRRTPRRPSSATTWSRRRCRTRAAGWSGA